MLIAAALSGCGAAGSDSFSKHTCVKCVTKCVHEQGWNPRNLQCSCPKPRLHFLFNAVGFWTVLNTKTLYSSISFLFFFLFMVFFFLNLATYFEVLEKDVSGQLK